MAILKTLFGILSKQVIQFLFQSGAQIRCGRPYIPMRPSHRLRDNPVDEILLFKQPGCQSELLGGLLCLGGVAP